MKKHMCLNIILCISLITLALLAGSVTKANKPTDKERNVYEKISSGDHVDYLIIGDSIGRGAGVQNPQSTWFAKLEAKLSRNYSISINRVSIVQSGATAFEGLIKLQKDSFPSHFDMAFIVFGENDRKYMNEKQFSQFYESLIRKVKQANPNAEIFTITESCLKIEAFANEIKKLSQYYGTVNIDMRKPFIGKNKELTKDNVHPNELGYSLYANKISRVISENITNSKAIPLYTPEPINSKSNLGYRFVHQVAENDGFVRVGNYYNSTSNSDSIQYTFTGTTVGVKVLRSPTGGKVDIFIDGNFTTTLSTWWPFERERYLYVKSGLSEGHHSIKFVHSNKQSTSPEGKSNLKISSIIVSSQ